MEIVDLTVEDSLPDSCGSDCDDIPAARIFVSPPVEKYALIFMYRQCTLFCHVCCSKVFAHLNCFNVVVFLPLFFQGEMLCNAS